MYEFDTKLNILTYCVQEARLKFQLAPLDCVVCKCACPCSCSCLPKCQTCESSKYKCLDYKCPLATQQFQQTEQQPPTPPKCTCGKQCPHPAPPATEIHQQSQANDTKVSLLKMNFSNLHESNMEK